MLEQPGPLVKSPLKICIEYGFKDMNAHDIHKLKTELTQLIKDRLRVRPDIELVPPFSLPRESGKISLIEIKANV
jgi:phenylacetate-coenzyme A ligase PaaK-like adenylate-forming protein